MASEAIMVKTLLEEDTKLLTFWDFQETFPKQYTKILQKASEKQRKQLNAKYQKAKKKAKKKAAQERAAQERAAQERAAQEQAAQERAAQERAARAARMKEREDKDEKGYEMETIRREVVQWERSRRKEAVQQLIETIKEQHNDENEGYDEARLEKAVQQLIEIQSQKWAKQESQKNPSQKKTNCGKKLSKKLILKVGEAQKVSLAKPLEKIKKEYNAAKKSWEKRCLYLKTNKLSIKKVLDEFSMLNKLLKAGLPCPDFVQEHMTNACDFWLRAFKGTIKIPLYRIGTQNNLGEGLDDWYMNGHFASRIATNRRHQLPDYLEILAHNEIMKDIIQNIFCEGLMIEKGSLILIPSIVDIQRDGIIYNDYIDRYRNRFIRHRDVPMGNWNFIQGLRDIPAHAINDDAYWKIVLHDSKTIPNIDNMNYEALLKNKPKVFVNRPELYLRYVVNNYYKNKEKYKLGTVAWVSVKSGRSPIYQSPVSLEPESEMIKIEFFEPNHANLIFFTPVYDDDRINLHLKCSYYDPNNKILPHVKALVIQMIGNLRTKVKKDDNIIIKQNIDWISPEDIPNTVSWHSMFGYTKNGVCKQVAYLFTLLWGKFGSYFRDPKHLWCHLSRALKWSIPSLSIQILKTFPKHKKYSYNKNLPQKLNELIPLFKIYLQKTMMLGNELYQDDVGLEYIKARISMIMKVEDLYKKYKERTIYWQENKKQIGGGKKIRKHQGILQTGGNAGRLKKGYRYSGKKLKSGLPQIIKCKSKKCKKFSSP